MKAPEEAPQRTFVGHGGVVRLQVEGDELSFVVPAGSAGGEGRNLLAGSVAPARSLLRHAPVTAAELEAVIAAVEDLVIPVIRTFASGEVLEASGPELGEVRDALAASAEGMPVPIESVEYLFNRLADVASGSPVGLQGVPVTATFVMGLVVLREVMHHGGYPSVVMLPAGPRSGYQGGAGR